MSLFGAIKMGGNTLRAMQIGLQVVGNNIANANTPGFIRQDAVYVPAPLQRLGNLILGSGVLVDSIVQKIDKFVIERLVGARGDRANAEIQEQVYQEIEGILNELSETADLSSALTNFFNAIHNVTEGEGTRDLVVKVGDTLTDAIGQLHGRVFNIREQLNDRVLAATGEINTLAEEIRLLNVQIATAEGGDTSGSDAGSLRVKRQTAVDRLSEIAGIQVQEQPSGTLSVAVGGEFLVFEGIRREVSISTNSDGGIDAGLIQFTDTQSPLQTTSGELQGLYTARDEVAGNFLDDLDTFARTLAFEFNKLYSQGQGLVGFDSLTSVDSVTDADAALDAAGLAFTPVGGAFDVLIHNKDDNLTSTYTILVDLNGFDNDTSLNDLAQQLDAIDGLTASVSATGALQLDAESEDIQFAFAKDTSGVLAALGVNTFFTGSSAGSLNVNAQVKANPSKFAASLEGIGEDAGNMERLAAFLDQELESANNATILDLYNEILNDITQGSAVAQSVAEGFRVFEGTLEGQKQAMSGVNIDEEAIKMITLQRIYQASAKYIQTISELLDILVQI